MAGVLVTDCTDPLTQCPAVTAQFELIKDAAQPPITEPYCRMPCHGHHPTTAGSPFTIIAGDTALVEMEGGSPFTIIAGDTALVEMEVWSPFTIIAGDTALVEVGMSNIFLCPQPPTI